MIWMRLAPYVIAATVALGAVGYVTYLRSANASLRDENAHLVREAAVQAEIVEQARLAQEVAEAYRKREAVRADEFQKANEALLKGDFGNVDTLIDPRIVSFLDCMRRAESGNTDSCARHLSRVEGAGPN